MDGVVRVVSLAQLSYAPKQRLQKDINGRNVTLLSHGGQIYAFDSVCYHMGGPLGAAGDIEELGSHLVISCPWHHRKIDLATGKQVNCNLQGHTCPTDDAMQRVYATRVDEAGFIWVDMRQAHGGFVPSDKYNAGLSQSSQFGYGLGSFSNATPQLRNNGENTSQLYAPEPPLTPYAGINKMAMSPSPIRTPDTQEQIPYRAQKSVSMRNANARMAVLQNLQKRSSQRPDAPQAGQRTLFDSFSRQAAMET